MSNQTEEYSTLEQLEEITTLVMYSDLLGFGNLVSSANGTFSSPVGRAALMKLNLLRKSLFNNEQHFPKGTSFYQLNDLAVASYDVDVNVGSMPIDSNSCYVSGQVNPVLFDAILKFISAAAKFHQQVINGENDNQLGQGCRTFLVIGKRWKVLNQPANSSVTEAQHLQANMAFAEAYVADSLGSSAGFKGGPWDRFYINDYLQMVCISAARGNTTVNQTIIQRLNGLGVRGSGRAFPDNLMRLPEVCVKLFHRDRKFYPWMSHWACQI